MSGSTATRRAKDSHSGKEKRAKHFSHDSRKALLRMLPVSVVVVALGGWFAYTELSRETPGGHIHGTEDHAATESEALAEIEAVRKEVREAPEDNAKLLRLANVLHDYSLSTDPTYLSQAIQNYRIYLTRNPSDGNARVDLGICYFESSRVDSSNASGLVHMAVEEMKTVYEADPTHQAAAFNLGIVILSSGQAELASEWFRRAITINPESSLGKRAQSILEKHSFSDQSEEPESK
jgi:tetratricopeptide (TPR) repeat protein